MSSNTIGRVVASTSLFSGTSSSLPESITLKASTCPWRGLSGSGWCCYPPAPAACAAFAAGLYSPNSTAGASLTFTIQRCGNAAGDPPSLMDHPVWLALPFLMLLTESPPCCNSTQILHSHNANKLSVQHLSSFTSQPQVQSLDQTLPKTGQSVEPVGLRPSAQEGEVASIPNRWGVLCWDASLLTSPGAEHSLSSALPL